MTDCLQDDGADYKLHPDYDRQINFEMEMREGIVLNRTLGGRAAAVQREQRASAKGQMTHLKPFAVALDTWHPAVAQAVRSFTTSWRRVSQRGDGPTPVSVQYLLTLDPDLSAFVALRVMLDAMSWNKQGQASVLTLARTIGTTLEHEAQMQAWEAQEPDLYYDNGKKLRRQKATSVHRRRVNIFKFNRLVAEGQIDWQEWTQADKTRIGLDLINIVMQVTQQFVLQDDVANYFEAKAKKQRMRKVITLQPQVYQQLVKAMDRLSYMSPIFLPTIMPPKRWTSVSKNPHDGFSGGGGYYTPHLNPRLLHFSKSQEVQRKNASAEYDARFEEMPKVFEALHAIQETGWRVNKTVLRCALALWKDDARVAGLPSREADPDLPCPVDFASKSPEMKAWRETKQGRDWRRAASRIRTRNALNATHAHVTGRTLTIAARLADERVFYFPHKLDFRGRMYPIPVDLQPQGSDLARGLLEFSEGKPLGDTGLAWLAINVATACGHDKVSFDERLDWVADNSERWVRIAADPMGEGLADWCHEKNAFQVLAAAIEYRAALDHPDGPEAYVSHMPVRVDGTCNGIQHLSAMIRDDITGRFVNLLPSGKPADIYREVAVRLQESLERIEEHGGDEGEKARWWLDTTERNIPRTLTKRPVMIVPYGGTRTAYFRYIREWLNDEHPEVWDTDDEEELEQIGKRIGYIAGPMWDIVQGFLPLPLRVMTYIRDCAKAASNGNQPIFWTTPAGFTVRHFYGVRKSKRVQTKIDGQVFTFRDAEVTDKLDIEEQLTAIPPNFVHSIDASAMMDTMVRMKAMGATHLTSIHDAYGTHASDMWLLHNTLRECFVETHKTDVLKEFRTACLKVVAGHLQAPMDVGGGGMDYEQAYEVAEGLLPPPLDYGDLNLDEVLNSDYFFA